MLNKTIIAALLAATALGPTLATAQERAAMIKRPSADRAQHRSERPHRDRVARTAVPASSARSTLIASARTAQDRDRRDSRRARGGDRRDKREGRRDDNRDRRQDRRVERHDRGADRRDSREDRRDRRREWGRSYADRTDHYRYDWNAHDRMRWNRSWRSDRRYDWRDHRSRYRSTYRMPRYYPPRDYHYGYRRFAIGIDLGPMLYQQRYWINDPGQYRLPPAYGPYRWVRYYNDALLVDIRSGEVVDVIYDIFW
ncbi:RcnB family protein [Stakelama saccharophila]|uniref:RcnB family protein n=1 Tax=Stakelama saccharophila TaxID=3075605 RepID=A0ABZ0BB56_9SPHN|nr:RcnB family protein [Stakelama sp. W311]WNO54583.1 RcnB family protein [Stakelama sp. W311]